MKHASWVEILAPTLAAGVLLGLLMLLISLVNHLLTRMRSLELRQDSTDVTLRSLDDDIGRISARITSQSSRRPRA